MIDQSFVVVYRENIVCIYIYIDLSLCFRLVNSSNCVCACKRFSHQLPSVIIGGKKEHQACLLAKMRCSLYAIGKFCVRDQGISEEEEKRTGTSKLTAWIQQRRQPQPHDTWSRYRLHPRYRHYYR